MVPAQETQEGHPASKQAMQVVVRLWKKTPQWSPVDGSSG